MALSDDVEFELKACSIFLSKVSCGQQENIIFMQQAELSFEDKSTHPWYFSVS